MKKQNVEFEIKINTSKAKEQINEVIKLLSVPLKFEIEVKEKNISLWQRIKKKLQLKFLNSNPKN